MNECNHCSAEMPGRRRLYCDQSCRSAAFYQRKKKAARAAEVEMDDLDDGTTMCFSCGKWFTQVRSTQRYCSNRCRQRFHRECVQEGIRD